MILRASFSAKTTFVGVITLSDMDLVFCGLTGGFRNPAANGKCVDRLLARIGLPRLKVHELRHNAATLPAARMNMPANVVQELLGHEDIETTLGLYAHADMEMQRKMMNDLDNFLGDLD
jgi:integrase